MFRYVIKTIPLIFLIFQFGGTINHEALLTETNRTKRQLLHHNITGIHLFNRDDVITYAFNNSVETEIPWIPDIFDWYQQHSCLNFKKVEMSYEGFKVIITYDDHIDACKAGPGQWSNDGLTGTPAFFGFRQCIKRIGSMGVFHELQHVLGNMHPMMDIRSSEFYKDANTNVSYEKHPELRRFGLPFDVGSNMMYPDDTDVMPTLEEYKTSAYAHPFPTFGDLRMLNVAYKCPDLCDPEDLFRCSLNLGIPDSRNCSTCLCPDGFEGPTCSDRRRSMFDNPPCGDTLYATAEPQNLIINIKQGKNFENYNATIDRISMKPLHPNVCVWHIRAPEGTIISLKVNATWFKEVPSIDPRTGKPPTSEEIEKWKEWKKWKEISLCTWGCLEAHLEVQLSDFDLKGYKYCCNRHIEEFPTFYSDNNLAVVIAVSGWSPLPMQTVTYQAVKND